MKPEGVRIVKKNGVEFEPELRHDGVDADGMDHWTAVFEGRFIAGEDALKVKRLPPRTSIGLDVRLPKGVDPNDVQASYSVRNDQQASPTEGETP